MGPYTHPDDLSLLNYLAGRHNTWWGREKMLPGPRPYHHPRDPKPLVVDRSPSIMNYMLGRSPTTGWGRVFGGTPAPVTAGKNQPHVRNAFKR